MDNARTVLLVDKFSNNVDLQPGWTRWITTFQIDLLDLS